MLGLVLLSGGLLAGAPSGAGSACVPAPSRRRQEFGRGAPLLPPRPVMAPEVRLLRDARSGAELVPARLRYLQHLAVHRSHDP